MAARRPQLHHLHTHFIALIIFSKIGLWLNLEYLSGTASFPSSFSLALIFISFLLELFVSQLFESDVSVHLQVVWWTKTFLSLQQNYLSTLVSFSAAHCLFYSLSITFSSVAFVKKLSTPPTLP